MKSLLTSLIVLLVVTSSIAQEAIEIDFSINQTGNQLVLDSIYIENLSSTCDTMLYFPNNRLSINLLSDIEDMQLNETGLYATVYPNPSKEISTIKVYSQEKGIHFSLFDIQGRKLLDKQFDTDAGEQHFQLQNGPSGQYVAKIQSGNAQHTVKIISESDSSSDLKLEYLGVASHQKEASKNGTTFQINHGDELQFTAWTTACQSSENISQTEIITQSESIIFDFTHLTNLQPNTPTLNHISASENEITWEWNNVDCNGYKYAYENNYSEAVELGTNTQMITDDLLAGTNYQLFIWAYNDCGASRALEMHQATTAIPFTVSENDTILNGSSSSVMDVMNIFEQPDSMILRTRSTNVLLNEENLEHLVSRMQYTVGAESGVGIAAPQVGINRRVIWVQRYDIGAIMHPWETYYNPRIIAYSDTVAYRSDGCLSVPSGGDYPNVEGFSYRAIWIDVEYYTETGERVVERINQQYTAHIFQHEIDHLNGIMYFDRQVEENKGHFTIIPGDSYEGLPPID